MALWSPSNGILHSGQKAPHDKWAGEMTNEQAKDPKEESGAGGVFGGFSSFAQLSQLAQLASQLDAQGLVAGVGQAMAWARDAVVAPHASHTDPAEHPECVICKGMSVVQGANGQSAETPAASTPIRWVPVTRLQDPYET